MNVGAFLFPGVGSQHVGMGKELYDNFKIVRDTFEEACDALNQNLVKMCFDDDGKTELQKLEHSQTALLTLSTAISRLYTGEIGPPPKYCLGHSLGEYSALCCAGVIEFTHVLSIVKQRGEILNRIAAGMDGIMAWVINLDNKIVEGITAESLREGEEIYVSAYDAPKQSSISGPKDIVLKVGKKLEKEGAIVYPLKLSGSFHSPFMKDAAVKLRVILEQYEYRQPRYPVIANYNALPYENKEDVVNHLSLQLINPIRWQASIEYLLENKIESAVELGPDKVLKHLMRNNTDSIQTFSLGNMNDLTVLKEKIKTSV